MESLEKIMAEGISYSPIEMTAELSPAVVSTSSSNFNWHKITLALLAVGICCGLIYYALNSKGNTATQVENEDNIKKGK